MKSHFKTGSDLSCKFSPYWKLVLVSKKILKFFIDNFVKKYPVVIGSLENMELFWLLCVLKVVEKPYSYWLILLSFVVAVQLSLRKIYPSWWISTYFPHHRVIRLKNQPLQKLLAKTSIFFILLQIIDI